MSMKHGHGSPLWGADRTRRWRGWAAAILSAVAWCLAAGAAYLLARSMTG